jgi:hypothetical protein
MQDIFRSNKRKSQKGRDKAQESRDPTQSYKKGFSKKQSQLASKKNPKDKSSVVDKWGGDGPLFMKSGGPSSGVKKLQQRMPQPTRFESSVVTIQEKEPAGKSGQKKKKKRTLSSSLGRAPLDERNQVFRDETSGYEDISTDYGHLSYFIKNNDNNGTSPLFNIFIGLLWRKRYKF